MSVAQAVVFGKVRLDSPKLVYGLVNTVSHCG